MATQQSVVSHLYLAVDGTPLSDELLRQFLTVAVDQHVHLPGMFTIRLADPELKLIDSGPFELAQKLKLLGSIKISSASS